MSIDDIRDYIRDAEQTVLIKQAIQEGFVQYQMQTFDQALFNLYKEGEITYDDALHYADSANEVRLMIKLDSGDVDQYAAAMDSIQLVEED